MYSVIQAHADNVDSTAQNVLRRTQYTKKMPWRYANIPGPAPQQGQERNLYTPNLGELAGFHAWKDWKTPPFALQRFLFPCGQGKGMTAMARAGRAQEGRLTWQGFAKCFRPLQPCELVRRLGDLPRCTTGRLQRTGFNHQQLTRNPARTSYTNTERSLIRFASLPAGLRLQDLGRVLLNAHTLQNLSLRTQLWEHTRNMCHLSVELL